MDKLGSIVVEKNSSTPLLVIAEGNNFYRTIPLVNKRNNSFFKLTSKDLTNEEDYNSNNLDNYSFDYDKIITISSMNVKTLATLTENGYCMVLRRYSSYQAALGATDRGYLSVRNDVHDQLIEMVNKGIRGF